MKAFYFEKISTLLLTLWMVLIVTTNSRILYFSFILSFPILLSAQLSPLSHPTFRHFTADDGLPSSLVSDILQDRKGFIWFATAYGVSRYNGYKFENFGALQGLSDLFVSYLKEDLQGRIWMQCESGRMFFFEKDSIYAFPGNKLIDDLKNQIDYAKDFIIDSTGQIYSSLYPVGLFKFSANGSYEQIIKDRGCAAFKNHNEALGVFARDQTDIHEMSNSINLKEQNKCDLTLYLENGIFYQNFQSKFHDGIINAFLLKDHTLLVNCNGNSFGFIGGKLKWQIAEPKYVYFSEFENAQGDIFIGLSLSGGVRHYCNAADLAIGNYEKLLEGYTISEIIQDREGGYWFVALINGVFYCPNPDIEIYNQSNGFPSEYVTSIALKNEYEIYVGLTKGGLINFDTRTQQITELQHGQPRTWDLVFDTLQNILWVSTLSSVYLQNNTWSQLINPSQGKAANYKNHFQNFSSNNEIWEIYPKAFTKFDPISKKATFQSTEIIEDDKPYCTPTFDVFESSTKRTWIANLNGLYELKNNQLIRPEKQSPVFQKRIDVLEELKDSTLVLGSFGYGLIFWKGDSIATLTEKDGLTANSINKMHVDHKGNLWVGTLSGLNKIHWSWQEIYEIQTMNIDNGLPSNEITDITSWNDDIWVATTKGVAHFLSQKLNHTTPTPILSSVLANNRLIDSASLDHLSYWENNLTINYFAINYKMNGQIAYRFRINSGEWSQTLNTSLNFPSLPPGKRVFEVQAQNEDGLWSESTFLLFVINPPWWNNWWAKTLYLLTALTLAYGVYNYNTRKLKQEYQIQLKINELERSALQAQMNPHFIFNCLNSIQNYILQNEKDSAIRYLGSFASLVRSMLNASVVGQISLEEEIKLLNNYLDLEKIRFKNRFTFQIRAAEGLDIFESMIPPLLVQPYVENAVKHGISGKKTGGKIEVLFEKSDHSLQVSISDNGTGINPDQDVLEKQNNHKSFGMAITQNRLELLFDDKLNNTVRSETLYDENKQISGTKVVIIIGLTKEV